MSELVQTVKEPQELETKFKLKEDVIIIYLMSYFWGISKLIHILVTFFNSTSSYV